MGKVSLMRLEIMIFDILWILVKTWKKKSIKSTSRKSNSSGRELKNKTSNINRLIMNSGNLSQLHSHKNLWCEMFQYWSKSFMLQLMLLPSSDYLWLCAIIKISSVCNFQPFSLVKLPKVSAISFEVASLWSDALTQAFYKHCTAEENILHEY